MCDSEFCDEMPHCPTSFPLGSPIINIIYSWHQTINVVCLDDLESPKAVLLMFHQKVNTVLFQYPWCTQSALCVEVLCLQIQPIRDQICRCGTTNWSSLMLPHNACFIHLIIRHLIILHHHKKKGEYNMIRYFEREFTFTYRLL